MRFTDQFINDLRDRISISDVVGSRVSWDKAKTRVNRGDYWGCCPFHGESRPSFHCEDRKGRYHCFGCGASGDHFRFFMELDGVSFPRSIEMVASLAGVSVPNAREETEQEKRARLKRNTERQARDAQRAADEQRELEQKATTVREIWSAGIPIAGTIAEKYLNSRDIEVDDLFTAKGWPLSLRFHGGLWLAGRKHPALIGGVQDVTRKLTAIWRIFLNADGSAVTDADGKKLKLGYGPAVGGAVRLGPVAPVLRIAEGIETALGVMCLTRGKAPVWATLSTSGMIGLEIPDSVQRLEIYADGDRHRLNKKTGAMMEPPGIVAANKLKERAEAAGVQVVIHPSPAPDDWLDVWSVRKRDDNEKRAIEYAG